MKIIISYPPLAREKGYPPAYPVVSATAATLLSCAGHSVIWNDCVAEGMNYQQSIEFIRKEKPDLVAFETKTSVVKQYWKVIDDIKVESGNGSSPKAVLFGSHVTALPEESFKNSKVDFVLAGGDYDFLLLNLCRHLCDAGNKLEAGIYYLENGQIKNTGQFLLNHDLNTLPFVDRDLTKWQIYSAKNVNFKRLPGTYIMSARDKPVLYPKLRTRSANNVLNEIGILIYRYKVREILDDSDYFPSGDWLKEFCNGMIATKYNKKVYLACNMRLGAVKEQDYRLMKKAGFRQISFRLESANQNTLDKLGNNLKVQDIIDGCKLAARSGLLPRITAMFGYPWETYEEALNTLKLGKWLLNKGFAYSMQAAIAMPYPGTPLFDESKEKGWLLSLNWDDYDMGQPLMQSTVSDDKIMELGRRANSRSFNPGLIIRKLFSLCIGN